MKHLKFAIIGMVVVVLVILVIMYSNKNGNIIHEILNDEENTSPTNENPINNTPSELNQDEEEIISKENEDEEGETISGAGGSSGTGGSASETTENTFDNVEDCESRRGTCYEPGETGDCKQYNADLILYSTIPCLIPGTEIIDATKICCIRRD